MNSLPIRRKLNKEPIYLPPATGSTAITRCCDAWCAAYQSAQDRGLGEVSVWLRANEAYRNAMPPLNSPENIRDFVACLAHGMIVNAITAPLSDRLLSAAKLAAAISRDISKAPKAAFPRTSRTGDLPPSPQNHALTRFPAV